MWSKSQVAAFQRAAANAAKLEPQIAKLRELAERTPQFKDRIEQLALRLENAKALSELALTIDPIGQ